MSPVLPDQVVAPELSSLHGDAGAGAHNTTGTMAAAATAAKQNASKPLTVDDLTPAEKNDLNRQWAERPGNILEHTNPAQVYDRKNRGDRQMKRGHRIESLSQSSDQNPNTGSTEFTGYQYEDVKNSADEVKVGITAPKHYNQTRLHTTSNQEAIGSGSKSNETTTTRYGDEDRMDLPHIGFLGTAKSGFEQAKNGFSHGMEHAGHSIEHAGHRLGLWDEETSTAATTTTTPPSHHADPILAFESSDNNNQTTGADATTNTTTASTMNAITGSSKQHSDSPVKSTTTGFSAIGLLLFLALFLWIGCVFKRRIQRKKGGRYASLRDRDGDGASNWKERANGDRGILAHEFEEFDHQVDYEGAEEGKGGR